MLCEFCLLYCDDVRLGACVRVIFKFLDLVSEAVYVDLMYDNVFVLWLIVVCEWVGGSLFVMGCCVVCAWCCCYELCVWMNGASPVRSVLSLFYLCAFQMKPVCVVTSD